ARKTSWILCADESELTRLRRLAASSNRGVVEDPDELITPKWLGHGLRRDPVRQRSGVTPGESETPLSPRKAPAPESPGPHAIPPRRAMLRSIRPKRRGRGSSRILGQTRIITDMNDITRILSAVERGDPSASRELLPLVYEEL